MRDWTDYLAILLWVAIFFMIWILPYAKKGIRWMRGGCWHHNFVVNEQGVRSIRCTKCGVWRDEGML
jgi:hypothetical protein